MHLDAAYAGTALANAAVAANDDDDYGDPDESYFFSAWAQWGDARGTLNCSPLGGSARGQSASTGSVAGAKGARQMDAKPSELLQKLLRQCGSCKNYAPTPPQA
eukprot:1393120-Amphidinium_carterae.1